MKKIVLALIALIIVGICIPVVSAGELLNTTYTEPVYDETHQTTDSSGTISGSTRGALCVIKIAPAQNYKGMNIRVVETTTRQAFTGISMGMAKDVDIYYTGTTYSTSGGTWCGEGTYGVFSFQSGGNTYQKYYLESDNWIMPATASSGYAFFRFYPKDGNTTGFYADVGKPYYDNSVKSPIGCFGYIGAGDTLLARSTHSLYVTSDWTNTITVTNDSNLYHISLNRNTYASRFYIESSTGILYDNTNSNNLNLDYPITLGELNIGVYNSVTGTWHNATVNALIPPIIDQPSTNANVTVYIRNSQTGAAIANSRCVIDALVNGEYHPVVNSTEPSGIFSVTLQRTGGGLPNPDGYRLIASADGYNNPMPEINFTVDEYTTSIYCYLDPIAGGPLDENKTFIDFFVRDMSANPISGATVNFGGYTLLTNSQGYTVFEVGKNATYTYTVSKSGYGPLTGNVVIGADPRHTINTVLGPAVTPTTTTPIPTGTAIGPTPTLTAPTGEPVSNWLEWFAAHFGMILGGGVEIGKIFMWLCFTVPVGVYVGKESKSGAAGFMAGAGIVTLFFVLIGWVPMWLVVLLALIIGLLYAKVFNTQDNGGGR